MMKQKMTVLLLGSGGREHALAYAIARSPGLQKLYAAPGNPGIGQIAELVALDITDHSAVIAFCKSNQVDFVVVGPEAPLVAGIVDDLAAAGIPAFGPAKFAAQVEGSKGFTNDICAKYKLPTAAPLRYRDETAAPAPPANGRAPHGVGCPRTSPKWRDLRPGAPSRGAVATGHSIDRYCGRRNDCAISGRWCG